MGSEFTLWYKETGANGYQNDEGKVRTRSAGWHHAGMNSEGSRLECGYHWAVIRSSQLRFRSMDFEVLRIHSHQDIGASWNRLFLGTRCRHLLLSPQVQVHAILLYMD